MTLFIDNYDSFSYTLVDYLKQLNVDPVVIRNDEWTLSQVIEAEPTAIIISPGPEIPARSGIVMKVIETFHTNTPILGICLGHQALGEFYGAALLRGQVPVHGKTAQVRHNSSALFAGIENPFEVMRYHSLELQSLPSDLTSTCHSSDGVVMGIQHQAFPSIGFQFHPESILTPSGLRLLHNWVSLYIGGT